jgi:hypothetical protein
MTTYQLKLALTIDVIIEEITNEDIEQHKRLFSLENIKRDKRLLEAVLKNKSVLRQYVLYSAASELEGLGSVDWLEMLGIEDDDLKEMLQPAIEALSIEDQKVYIEAEEEGFFYESTAFFHDAFVTDIDIQVESLPTIE